MKLWKLAGGLFCSAGGCRASRILENVGVQGWCGLDLQPPRFADVCLLSKRPQIPFALRSKMPTDRQSVHLQNSNNFTIRRGHLDCFVTNSEHQGPTLQLAKWLTI